MNNNNNQQPPSGLHPSKSGGNGNDDDDDTRNTVETLAAQRRSLKAQLKDHDLNSLLSEKLDKAESANLSTTASVEKEQLMGAAESVPTVLRESDNTHHTEFVDEEQAPLQSSTDAGTMNKEQQLQPFEETGRLLAEDIYSVFHTAQLGSGASRCSFLVIFGQIFLLTLILLDLSDFGGHYPLQVPPGVPLLVNLAQFFGIIMTAWFLETNGDLMKGCERFLDRYDPQILTVFPHATKTNWIVASCFQMVAGLLMVLDLFILLMQSTTIIMLCLNFAALHFVNEVPDVAFISFSKGVMVSHKVQDACLKVLHTKVPPTRDDYKGTLHLLRRIGMFGILTVLYTGYFVLLTWQWNGKYMCSDLYVQFGDAFHPEMAYFSGRFEGQGFRPTERIASREYFLDETQTIRLAYCHSEEAWTFSRLADDDHCHYFIKSIRTTTFDVTDLAGTSNWLAKHPVTKKDVPTDWLYLGCNECNSDTCEHGHCGDDSHHAQCICDEGYMGQNCEFPVPTCTHLDIDLRSQKVLAKSDGAEFLLESGESGFRTHQSARTGSAVLQLRYFPVYMSIESTELTHNMAILAFIGRRWALFGRTGRDYFNAGEEYQRLYELLVDRPEGDSILSFKGDSWFVENYRPYFFSEPVDLSTESFSLEPIGLNWYQARADPTMNVVGYHADEGQFSGFKLQCADCDPEYNPCQNGGYCNVTGHGERHTKHGLGNCVCVFPFTGTLCESAQTCNEIGGCMHNGTCDEYNYCECEAPYSGSLCQNYPTNFEPPPSCTRDPCLNEGKCNILEGTCDCSDQFSGERCEIAN